MIKLDSAFEGGNIENISFKTPRHIVFDARKGSSPSPLWFHFHAKGTKGKEITFELKNAHDVKNKFSYLDDPENWPYARPVYTYDRKIYRRMKPGIYQNGSYIFTHRFTRDNAYISYAHPYFYSDINAYLDSISKSPFCKISSIGKTEENRDIHYLQISNFKLDKPKRGVWILARQHAGETPGSYVCEGIINSILANTKSASKLRDDFIFNIIPMVDIDNVCKGNYGKDSQPIDFNRDWTPKSIRKEIKLIKTLMAKYAKDNSIDIFLDLHAPGMSQGNGYHSSLQKDDKKSDFERELRFAHLLMRNSPSQCPYIYAAEGGHGINGMAIRYIYEAFGCLSVILENSYHRPVKNKALYTNPAAMRKYGRAVTKTIIDFFNLK